MGGREAHVSSQVRVQSFLARKLRQQELAVTNPTVLRTREAEGNMSARLIPYLCAV